MFGFGKKKDSGSGRKQYTDRQLNKMSYTELNEEREKVRQDTSRPDWRSTLNQFDRALSKKNHPVRERAMKLSDEELDKAIEKAQGTSDVSYLIDERSARRAAANPDKPRRSREHGYNLWKDD